MLIVFQIMTTAATASETSLTFVNVYEAGGDFLLLVELCVFALRA